MREVIVVGAGIVGLAVARELQCSQPGVRVTVVDKEDRVGAHQTGHNSGVIHAGVYYQPGSLKARLCVRGVQLLRRFCAEHATPIEDCGKVVVALDDEELPRLEAIFERGVANGVPELRRVTGDELLEVEPHTRGVAAIHSPKTAIVDFTAVTRSLAEDVRSGGEIRLGAQVVGIDTDSGRRVSVVLDDGERLGADQVVVCAGLHSDRVATLAGDDPDPRIIPFRGEYYRLAAHATQLVRGLIYPVPDPRYPFLGIHLTRTMSGDVLVGPNAVLALSREGYTKAGLSPRDLYETLAWPGFRRMARKHWRTGVVELRRSASRRRFIAEARRYVPELSTRDVERAPAGVRAQAVARDGTLVDDFRLSRRGNVLNVRNAPSPAATSSLAIAEHICRELRE